MLTRRGVALAAVVVLLFAGCGRSRASEINRIESVPVKLDVVLRGDVQMTYHDTAPARLVVRHVNDKDAAEGTNVMGVEIEAPVQVGKSAFVAGIGILPYTGDGTYTIGVGSLMEDVKRAQAAGQQPQLRSSIKVEYWPTGGSDEGSQAFMRRAKPCRVVVKDEGSRGTAVCPDITDDTGTKHFSMSFKWTAPRRAVSATAPSAGSSSTNPQP